MILVTLHGGNPEEDPHKNNVHAYDKDGNRLTSSLLDDDKNLTLNELRGIYVAGEYLYVVNANKDQNSILCYRGSGTRYSFVSTFVSHHTCKAILHPFDLAFDGAGHCYVSSQDTNVVTRLAISADGKTAAPAPLAPALAGKGAFLPGTFVASSDGALTEPHTTAVSPPAGLQYSATGAKKHSVRGLAWAKGVLYVADQPAGTIKIYDRRGEFCGESNAVETPVHLVIRDEHLYVTGGDQVMMGELPDPPGPFRLTAIDGVKVKNASGVTFGNSGNIYVASRTENRIFKFDSSFRLMKFRCELPDNPEFLLHV